MTPSDLDWWTMLLNFIGHLSVALIGLATLAMAWKAPDDGSMPLVLREEDRKRDDGIRNVRQVGLSIVGVILIALGAKGLV